MRTLLALWVLICTGCGSDSTELVPSDGIQVDPETLDPPGYSEADALSCAAEDTPAYMAELEDARRGLCDDTALSAQNAVSHEALLDQSTVLGVGAPDRAREIDGGRESGATAHALAAPDELGGVCQERIRALLGSEGSSGAPELEANRARILAYAKAEPVLFIRTPRADPNASPSAKSYRERIARSSSPWSLIQKLLLVFTLNPSLGRQVLLREGYLYAEKPELSFALVDLVKANHLFDAERIWIQRGERVLTALRSNYGAYVYDDGPERGQRVRLLLFDRIGAGDVPAALHRDFRSLRRRLGFDRVEVRHITEDELLVELRYGSVSVPSVLSAKGAELDLGCELLAPEEAPRVSAARARYARSLNVLGPLRRAMLSGVEEGLPFDEPLTEYGQQDGQLRRFWLRAYLDGKSTYEINGDRYSTFDPRGRPLVPQVCVDFVFDTLERASGTWWRSRGEAPGRSTGKLDFGTVANEALRRASSFIELAQTRKDWFDTWEVPDSERIPLKASSSFVDYVLEHAADFVPGDVVLIRGYAPWDKPWRPRVMHFHSFFVYETDPITGFPAMLVGNPGRPLLQTWQFEAFRTPDRAIWYRMRPRLEWLEEVIPTRSDEDAKLDDVPLAAGPN